MNFSRSLAQVFLIAAFLLLAFAQIRIPAGLFRWYPLDILTLAACACLMPIFFRHPLKNRRLPKGLFLGGSLFLAGSLLSFFLNPMTLTGTGRLFSWVLIPMLASALLYSLTSSRKLLREVLLAWFLGTLLIAALSFSAALRHTGITYDSRLAGIYASPNFLGFLLGGGFLLALYLFFSERSLFGKACFAAAGFFLLIMTLWTRSYAVLFGLLAAGSFFLFPVWKEGRTHRRTLGALLVLLVMILMPFAIQELRSPKAAALFSYDSRSSLASRLIIWRSAATMLSERPLAGIGIGRFQEEYLNYQDRFPPYLEWAVPEPHNLALAVWLQGGLIGLAGFFSLAFFSVRALLRARREGLAGEASLLLALWILLLAYGVFDTPYFRNDLAFLFWVLVALSLGTEKSGLRPLLQTTQRPLTDRSD